MMIIDVSEGGPNRVQVEVVPFQQSWKTSKYSNRAVKCSIKVTDPVNFETLATDDNY